ncbi:MAG: hypothetical protein AAF648_04930 [Pseudomonadota bacterium]
MTDEPSTDVWRYRFLMSGLGTDSEARLDLDESLRPLVEGLVDLQILPVNHGVQVDLALRPIERYDRDAFEAYLHDQVLIPVGRSMLGARADELSITPLQARSRG